MAKPCSLSSFAGSPCGSSRGLDESVKLNSCTDDITAHLAKYHLSREPVTEKDLILARVRLYELEEKQIEVMDVCPKHRHSFGKFWRPSTLCQHPEHGRNKAAIAGTHVVNFKLMKEIRTIYGQNVPVGSPISTTCRKKHADRVTNKAEWLRPNTLDETVPRQRPAKDVAMETISCLMSTTPLREPQTLRAGLVTTPCWTPGFKYDIPESRDVIGAYNSAMDEIASLVKPPATREPLTSQFKFPLKTVCKEEKSRIIEKAREDCFLICKLIAPQNAKELFASMSRSVAESSNDCPVSDDLVVLMTAYKNACTRNLKRQILSLYAYRYPVRLLQKLHEPYGNLSTWQINQARLHAHSCGPGTLPVNEKRHRVRLDMTKVDHFVEFVNRPHFYQDVSYGSKILTLDSGEKIEMPNVVRTVTRSTMVSQYFEYCIEQEFEPLSRSTLFKIMEVREASQRKSLQGFDNTAADGAAGFQTIETIIEECECFQENWN